MTEVKNLTKIYRSGGCETVALDRVSCVFGDRGLVFLLGKNGSGKTTFLDLLGGLDEPTSGGLVVNGKDIRTFTQADLDDYRSRCVGFIFQEYCLLPGYTVGENVGIALELLGGKADKEKIDAVLRQVGLMDERGETMADRKICELSGGQKQRVAIARALVKDPQIILADEPMAALDALGGHELYRLLQKISKERLVVVVTHDVTAAKKFGDRILTLADGRLISDSAPQSPLPPREKQPERYARGGLPLRKIFAMGVAGLKGSPFRLVLSVLLSVFALFAVGFSMTAARADLVLTEISTLFSYGERMVLAEAPWATDGNVFNPSLQTALESVSSSEPLLVCEFRFPLSSPTAFYNLLGDGAQEAAFLAGFSDPYHYVGASDMDCAVELENASAARLLPDPRFADPSLCRVPHSPDEIALSDLRADMLLEFGFRESEDAPLTQCGSVDELIGKKIGALTICGVFATETDKSYFEERKNINYSSLADNDELYLRAESAARRSVLSFAYVCKGFHAVHGLSLRGLLFAAEGSAEQVADVLNGLSFREGSTGKKYEISLDTTVSRLVPFEGTVELIAAIGGGAGALFCAVGGLMTLHFMSVSVEFRKKEIAVLRALGAKRRETVGICVTEGGILALGELILAVAALFAASATANAYCKALIFLPGFSEVGVLLLLCLSLTAAAISLPAYHVAKMSPAAALRTV